MCSSSSSAESHAHASTDDNNGRPSPAPTTTRSHVDPADESTWKVLDRIVAERQPARRRAGREYCVRWKGSLHPDEWVPVDDDAWLDGSTGGALETWLALVVSEPPKAALGEAAPRAASGTSKRRRVW